MFSFKLLDENDLSFKKLKELINTTLMLTVLVKDEVLMVYYDTSNIFWVVY